jgi:hypothetical protein
MILCVRRTLPITSGRFENPVGSCRETFWHAMPVAAPPATSFCLPSRPRGRAQRPASRLGFRIPHSALEMACNLQLGCSPFCILPSSFCISPLPPPELRRLRRHVSEYLHRTFNRLTPRSDPSAPTAAVSAFFLLPSAFPPSRPPGTAATAAYFLLLPARLQCQRAAPRRGPKARHVTAWGEAPSEAPGKRHQLILYRPEGAGHRTRHQCQQAVEVAI